MLIVGALALAVVLPLFVSLGLWQWHKAETTAATQAELDRRNRDQPLLLTDTPVAAEQLRFRRVILRGRFDAAHQVLIDNRLYQERAGYHVITPFQLDGSQRHVLVNRGWIPAAAEHAQTPTVTVPEGWLELTGIAVQPPRRFFNLAPQPSRGWAAVWQNLDLQRFRHAVPYPLADVVIELDATTPAGFVRDWPRPDEWSARHRSYALQWFGFALSSLAIWIYFLVRRA